MSRLIDFLKLKEILNNEESELFKEFYHARFFKGDITIIDSEETVTMSFHRGTCIDVMEGIPDTGIDVGVAGSAAAWEDFATHKSLSVATNKRNAASLETMGGRIRVRQNFNVLAYLTRIYSSIRSEGREVDGNTRILSKG